MKSAVERIVFPQAPKGSWLKALSARMAQERTQIRGVSDSNRKRSADELAQRLSAAPPPQKKSDLECRCPGVDRVGARCTPYPVVLFAVYLDARGERLTRHLNRQDSRVRALLAKDEGGGALDKLLLQPMILACISLRRQSGQGVRILAGCFWGVRCIG
jgi:hypothetical protein